MNGIGEGRSASNGGGRDPWRLVAVPALGAAIGFALALALPARSEASAADPAVRSTCPAMAAILPPGHPPLPGLAAAPAPSGIPLPPGHPPIPGLGVPPQAGSLSLPPGHPPLPGPGARPAPVQVVGSDAPAIVEI